jgi:ABC-type arginine transport system permease subunit
LNEQKPSRHRLTLAAIWFLATPSLIFLFLIIPFFSMDRVHLLPSECSGCMALMLLAAPIVLVVAKAGFFVCAVIGALWTQILRAHDSPRKLKVEAGVALGFSLLAAIVAIVLPWR